jgi:hypothetical protein
MKLRVGGRDGLRNLRNSNKNENILDEEMLTLRLHFTHGFLSFLKIFVCVNDVIKRIKENVTIANTAYQLDHFITEVK